MGGAESRTTRGMAGTAESRTTWGLGWAEAISSRGRAQKLLAEWRSGKSVARADTGVISLPTQRHSIGRQLPLIFKDVNESRLSSIGVSMDGAAKEAPSKSISKVSRDDGRLKGGKTERDDGRPATIKTRGQGKLAR